jgi:hypothetical protein
LKEDCTVSQGLQRTVALEKKTRKVKKKKNKTKKRRVGRKKKKKKERRRNVGITEFEQGWQNFSMPNARSTTKLSCQ